MNEGTTIVKKGQVEQTVDSADGLRIKVRLKEDGNTPLDKLPYCFPLLPKSFQSVPKIGEGAFILTTMSENNESQRYYIGPIISQPQYNNMCYYDNGRGEALSLIDGGTVGPLESISNFAPTKGAFPNTEDVAVVGRGTQDIILRENKTNCSNEIDLRCGIRKGSDLEIDSEKGLIGDVVFNANDPAYIQLKHKHALTNKPDQEASSVINVVADKVNIVSHQDENHFNLTNNKELVPENEMDDMMEKLHEIPLGDKLIKLLEKMIVAIYSHVHPCAGMIPVEDQTIAEIKPYGIEKLYDEILSKHVRIS